MTYMALVQYRPAYFNRRCMANIPARWTAEVTDGLPAGVNVYADGCASRQEAVDDLIAKLKSRGFTGRLRIVK